MNALTIITACIVIALTLRALENFHLNHTRQNTLDLNNRKQVNKALRKYKHLED